MTQEGGSRVDERDRERVEFDRRKLREGGRGVVEKEIVKGEGKRGGEIKKHKGWRVRKEIKTSN